MASQRQPALEAATAAGLASQASELSPLAAEFRRAASSLNGIAAGVMIRQYEARSDDGAVTVTVDGGGRVASVHIGEHAIRSGPDRVAASLTVAVNRALEAARQGTTDSMLDAAGPGSSALLRGAVAAAADLPGTTAREEAGARSVTGRSADGSVAAKASGLGALTSITVSPTAVRIGRDGRARLGASAAEAMNAALKEAGSLHRAQPGPAGPAPAPGDARSAGAAALASFSSRVDELLGNLDQIDRDLDRLVEGAMSDMTRLAGRLSDRGGETGGPAGS